jgi:hypothetical protein
VTIVILLVLVVVLWVVVLVPGALRRRAERRGDGSIEHFHQQLQLLEHAGPKLVTPAYRLHTALPGGDGSGEMPAIASISSRPKLVLLRPVDDEETADVDDLDGCHYERVGVLDRPEPITPRHQTRAGLNDYRRQQARQRCSMLLRCLVAASISTALIGMFPALHLLWIGTGITGLAALGLLGLIAYAKEVETLQSRRRPSYASPPWLDAPEIDDPYVAAATAGYPGAWDEEYEQMLPDRIASAR